MSAVIHGNADVYVRRVKHEGNFITTARSSHRDRQTRKKRWAETEEDTDYRSKELDRSGFAQP